MARRAGGANQLVLARELLKAAKTTAVLLTTQAVLLPLELGMSLEETAKRLLNAQSDRRVAYAHALL